MKNLNQYIITVVLLLLVGTGGFFAGTKYQQSKAPAAFGQRNNQRNAAGGNRMGFRPVSGEIVASDDKSITVKLPDGSSKIVLLSDKTVVNKASTGTKDDLKNGTKVAVFGNENPDGSVSAANIQINPITSVLGARTPNQGTKSPDAREIVVEGENYHFIPETIRVKKGEKVRILFKSMDGIHDFRIDELNIVTATVRSGQEDFVEFTPDKTGSFKFYCSVGNHRAMGMEGTLVVE